MLHPRMALAWLLAVLLVCAGCLLPAQQPQPADDDTADDDDVSDDDDNGDDDTWTPDDDDDDTTPPDDDDDDSVPPHPQGDYLVGWAWVFLYEDAGLGSEYAAYTGVWNIGGNNINGNMRMGVMDGDLNELCAMEMSLGGVEMTTQFNVASAQWAVDGQITIDECWGAYEGQAYETFLAVAPKADAFADIQARYGISVADQETAEVEVASQVGLDPGEYFMYVGDDPSELGPFGFMMEM